MLGAEAISAILEATSLLPTGMEFAMVVDMIVVVDMGVFLRGQFVTRNLDGGA